MCCFEKAYENYRLTFNQDFFKKKGSNHLFEGKTSNRDAKSQESDTSIIRGTKIGNRMKENK